MEYKPNVGLVDFFAVLLPGALLAFLLKGKIPPNINFPSTEGWVAFVFAAYLLGQFTYLVGATFMDRIYDLTYLRYMTRGGDALWEKAKKRVGDKAKMASELKWIRAYVRLSSPDAAIEIERFEATSKFFRSLFIVLLVYAGYFCLPLAMARFCRHPRVVGSVLLALLRSKMEVYGIVLPILLPVDC